MTEQGFNVDTFAAFWANPSADLVTTHVIAEDVVGDWPGMEPVRGIDAYRGVIGEVLELIPDFHMEVAEHATSGEYVFVRWIAHGTTPDGPLDLTGIDRIKVGEDGRVVENIIRFDPRVLLDLMAAKAA
jgi:limonene-1,2-epoxide hydrolase